SMNGQLWIDSAPPPDVVTLFRPGLWTREFKTLAQTDEHEEMCEQDRALSISVKRFVGEKWSRPSPLKLGDDTSSNGVHSPSKAFWNYVERGVGKAARIAGLSRFAPRQPSEFGLFVKMVRLAA